MRIPALIDAYAHPDTRTPYALVHACVHPRLHVHTSISYMYPCSHTRLHSRVRTHTYATHTRYRMCTHMSIQALIHAYVHKHTPHLTIMCIIHTRTRVRTHIRHTSYFCSSLFRPPALRTL